MMLEDAGGPSTSYIAGRHSMSRIYIASQPAD